jgi:hypothetical protein
MAERAAASPSEHDERAPEAAVGALLLVERRRVRPPGEEWSALAPDGRLLDVWRVVELDPARLARDVAALSRLVGVRHPGLVPVLAAGERDGGVWVVSRPDAGRSLRRLLAIATLTPEQAAAVAIGVLDGLGALHAAGIRHGRLDERAVHVGPAGQVRLGGWGLDVDPPREAVDLAAAVELLGRLGRNVQRSGGRQSARGQAFREALLACDARAGDEAALLARAGEAAEALVPGAAGERAARELAILVGKLERNPPPARRQEEAPARLRGVGRRHPLLTPAAAWAPPPHRARWIAAGLAVLLVAGAGAFGLVAGHPRAATAAAVHPRPAATARPAPAARAPAHPRPSVRPRQAAARPARAPTPAGLRPLPNLAPPTAGPITAVEIQPLGGSCQLGAACPVQVTVRLQPQPSAEEVRWSFRVFDRCTGATSVLTGVSVTALAGWAYVHGTSSPALSASHPVALVAVTDTPAAAASPAVLAGGSGPC